MAWLPLYHWLVGNRLVRTLADRFFVGYARRRMAELDVLDVGRAQEHALLRLVRRAQNTRFGRDHDFGRIRTITDYRRLVPLRDYEAFWTEYWQPVYPDLGGATWPGPIPYLALSSGTTTGTTKYIPVSPEMLRSNTRAALTLLCGFANAEPDAQLFQGKIFFLGGSTDLRVLGQTAAGSRRRPISICAGDLSGIAVAETPSCIRPFAFPPPDLALLTDWDEKIRLLAQRSLSEHITMISGVPSWLLIFFHQLKQLAGKPTVEAIWPSLRLVIHGGVKFEPYRETMRRELGSHRIRLVESYPCSEGFVAFEDPRYQLLRLVPDHDIFFEFVPVEELQMAQPRRHSATEVEIGVNYAVVLTTCAGLWSYVVGDTVAFERRQPPLLRFTGRTRYFLSAFGEHLISEEVERALQSAAMAIAESALEFHVGPQFPADGRERGRHLFLVEFGRPPGAKLPRFAEELDTQLCRLNEDYEAHRRGGVGMDAPLVCSVAAGGFAAWMRSRGKLGGQHKVPRMDPTGELTSEIYAWLAAHGWLENPGPATAAAGPPHERSAAGM